MYVRDEKTCRGQGRGVGEREYPDDPGHFQRISLTSFWWEFAPRSRNPSCTFSHLFRVRREQAYLATFARQSSYADRCERLQLGQPGRKLSDSRLLSNIAIAVDSVMELGVDCCIIIRLVGRHSFAARNLLQEKSQHCCAVSIRKHA